MAVTMTNSLEIVAYTISVIDKDRVIYLKEVCLSNLYAVNNIVGLPIDTLNSLQQLAEPTNSDATFVDTRMNAIKLNSDLAYVNILCEYSITKPFKYDTTDESTIKCLTKPNTNWDRYTRLN